MARLIDYHTNCGCGADVHVAARIDEHAQLHVATQVGALPGIVQTTDLANSMLDQATTSLVAAKLADGTLRTDVIKQGNGHSAETANALDRAHVIITQLTAAATWLVNQAEAGEGIDLDEVRTRFGIDNSHSDAINDEADRAADDDTAAPNHTTDTAPTRPAANQRAKRATPSRPGGG